MEPATPDAPDAPPDAESGAFSREQILNEAIRLLEENGTIGFRVHDLAERLGVTASALYYHFRNRDAIIQDAYLEVFRRERAANLEFATTLARLDLTGDERLAELTTLVERLRAAGAQRLRRTRLTALLSLREDPITQAALGEILKGANALTTDAYRDSQSRGAVRGDIDPEALALFSRILLAGLIVWDVDESLSVTPRDLAGLLDVVFAGLANTPPDAAVAGGVVAS